MRTIYLRTTLAVIVAAAVSLGLYIYAIDSRYVLAVGLALGCYLAQLSTFQGGLRFGWAASFPLAAYMAWIGLMPADSNEAAVILNALLLIVFGALYCGAITWLIQSLKNGKVIFG